MPAFIKTLLQQSSIGQSRSSALNPLQWVLVILLTGVVICPLVNAPSWLLIILVGLTVGIVILIATSYVYFMLKNSDALRSEHYTLSKIALEKGLVGDNLRGLFDPTHALSERSASSLPSTRSQENTKKQ